MRTAVFLFSLLQWARGPSSVSALQITISGVDPGNPLKSSADLLGGNAGDNHRIKSREQRAADMPSMCEVADMACSRYDDLTLKDLSKVLLFVDIELDCMRSCRNPCYGDPDEFTCSKLCTSAVVMNGMCYLNLGSGDCTRTSSPGSTLYLPLAPGGKCTEGVPAPGFPEDNNSKEYCLWPDLECPDTDTMLEFEPELRTCRATCTSDVFCQNAWYDKDRWCHLRRNTCSKLADFKPSPGAFTLIVRPFSDKGKDCPTGANIYVPPAAMFNDQYCAWKGLKCDLPETTDMYYGSKTPTRGYPVANAAACIDKCTHIFSCGSAWTMTDPNDPTAVSCVMQRLPARCPATDIVRSDDPTQMLYLRIAMSEGDPSTVNTAEELADLCTKYYVEQLPWKETYCGYEGAKCAATVITSAPLTAPVACLTACRNQPGCSGANLRKSGSNPCDLLSGDTCTKDPTPGRIALTSAVGYTYFRQKVGTETCPFPMSDCADQYMYVTEPKMPSPPTVTTCGAAKGGPCPDKSVCGTKSCKSPAETTTCSATPLDKCACKSYFLYSETAGTCVTPALCPCYHADTVNVARPVGSMWWSAGCKQQLMCAANGSGVPPKISTKDTSDALCGPNIMCLPGTTEGYCICPVDSSFVAGTGCVKQA